MLLENRMARCDKCQVVISDEHIFTRDGNPDIWNAAVGDEFEHICIPCMDHQVCFPFYELRFTHNLSSARRAKLGAAPHKCCLSWYYESQSNSN